MKQFKKGDRVRLVDDIVKMGLDIKKGSEGVVTIAWVDPVVSFSGESVLVLNSNLEHVEQRTSESTAVTTLKGLGYTWNGGEQWKPPIGKPWVDLTQLDVPFGELDRATQLRIVEHVLDGGKIERFDGGLTGWSSDNVGENGLLCFVPKRKYRAVAAPVEQTEQTINITPLEQKAVKVAKELEGLIEVIGEIKQCLSKS